ncbi:MAG TPA: ribosome maturation factor RimP [Acidimicrobiales bacterium]|jgi:ribosome maturation factor RimP|nr:ribosome maturation factor RimP [Acidimicrobiales bacterium]
MAGTENLETALGPICSSLGVELVDLELAGRSLQLTIERPEPIDLELVAEVTRIVSGFLDEHEALAPSGQYDLEVSSPGLERRLRRPEHFRRAIGEMVTLRTLPDVEGARRIEGVIASVDEGGLTLSLADAATRHLAFDEIERAKTVFDWQEALRVDGQHRDAIDDERGKRKMTAKTREAQR